MNAIAEAIRLAGGPARVAGELRVSAQAVCFWRDGKRQMPAETLARLERLCGFAWRRWDFRPNDWHEIWPELVHVAGAPNPLTPSPAQGLKTVKEG